jgi:hypothetical protein
MREFKDGDGNILVWVFPSPGRFWKDRWVAFTNSGEIIYFKGTKDLVYQWAKDYVEKITKEEASV